MRSLLFGDLFVVVLVLVVVLLFGPPALAGEPVGTVKTTDCGRVIRMSEDGKWRYAADCLPATDHGPAQTLVGASPQRLGSVVIGVGPGDITLGTKPVTVPIRIVRPLALQPPQQAVPWTPFGVQQTCVNGKCR